MSESEDDLKLLDMKAVANLLGVHRNSIVALLRKGQIPAPIVSGRKKFWTKAQFTKWHKIALNCTEMHSGPETHS